MMQKGKKKNINKKKLVNKEKPKFINKRDFKDYGLLKENFLKVDFNKDPSKGLVISIIDSIVSIKGLKGVKSGELLKFKNKKNKKIIKGMAVVLNELSVEAVLFDDERYLFEGDSVEGTNKIISIVRGENLLGRVVNALGEPIDGGVPITGELVPIEEKAPGVIKRKPITLSLSTGIKVIDSLLPLGRGQRQLIIGDRKTGKTSIAIDTILNQKESNKDSFGEPVYCVYVSIGQKRSSVKQLSRLLSKRGALDYSVIVAASAAEAAPLQFLAAFTGCAIAEYFRDNAMHALVVYDDLSKQAIAFRQMSLLLKRPPGREAYPGDVFYLHARLLERASNLRSGGSLTALPIIETFNNDVSAYIATNVISITDGQIFLDADLFHDGMKPAVDVGLSVSRVGAASQCLAVRRLAGNLKVKLARYRLALDFQRFGSDVDQQTLNTIEEGEKLVTILNQGRYSPVQIQDQVLYLLCVQNGELTNIDLKDIPSFMKDLIEFSNKFSLFSLHKKMISNDDYFNKYQHRYLTFALKFFRLIRKQHDWIS